MKAIFALEVEIFVALATAPAGLFKMGGIKA